MESRSGEFYAVPTCRKALHVLEWKPNKVIQRATRALSVEGRSRVGKVLFAALDELWARMTHTIQHGPEPECDAADAIEATECHKVGLCLCTLAGRKGKRAHASIGRAFRRAFPAKTDGRKELGWARIFALFQGAEVWADGADAAPATPRECERHWLHIGFINMSTMQFDAHRLDVQQCSGAHHLLYM